MFSPLPAWTKSFVFLYWILNLGVKMNLCYDNVKITGFMFFCLKWSCILNIGRLIYLYTWARKGMKWRPKVWSGRKMSSPPPVFTNDQCSYGVLKTWIDKLIVLYIFLVRNIVHRGAMCIPNWIGCDYPVFFSESYFMRKWGK